MSHCNNLKVLHLVSTTGFAGLESFIIELSKVLLNTRYQPIVGVINNLHNPHHELEKVAKQQNLETQVFKCRGRIDYQTVSSIKRFIKEKNVKLVHSHQYKANFYTLWATNKPKVPRITTCHLYDDKNYNLKSKFYTWLDKTLLNRFDYIVTTSDHIKTEILQHRIDKSKINVIYNGIDISRFESPKDRVKIRTSLGIKPEAKVVGTVGRLSPQKNHMVLLQSAEKIIKVIPNTFFIIVGEGPLREQLQQKITQLKLTNHVLLTGSRNDIPDLLAAMDVFVLPSLDEGLPFAILEAMATKLPVIATPVGSVSKVLQNNLSGLLIENNPKSLSEAIFYLLRTPKEARILGENGYKTVVDNFTNNKMAEKYLQIYEKVALNHPYH